MLFSEVLGLDHIKNHLITSVQNGRVPHAQLFVGQGVVPIAIAYAQYLLCENSGEENKEGSVDCNLKVNKLSHPDLHFVYPVSTNDQVKKHPVSSHFVEEWRAFVLENSYADIFEWYQKIGIEKKQGLISVYEAQDMVKTLSLKAYEGGFKVMIVWMADKMNTECANKILKLLEEPPEKTVFILITDDDEQLLSTITSRCQILRIPLLSEEAIAQGLVSREGVAYDIAKGFARQASGVYNKALQLLKEQSEDALFEKWMIVWVRAAFRAKGNKTVVQELLVWSENVASMGREVQKKFLDYCVSFFRQALLLNYQAPSLVYLQILDANFALEKFAPFVHGGNILDIIEALEAANYHIERNGNAKIIFTNLSLQLTRLLHKKQVSNEIS